MNHGRYFSNTWWKKRIFCQKWTNNSKAKSSEETSSHMSPMRQILQFITKKCSWDKVDQEQWIKHLACDDDCLLLCNMLKIKTVTSFHSSNPLPLAFPELLSCLTLSISTLPLVLHMTLTLESNRTPTQWQTANHEIMISMAFGKKTTAWRANRIGQAHSRWCGVHLNMRRATHQDSFTVSQG